MPRIYLPISHIKDNRISITDEKAHHLTSVLRCRKGDELIVFDGKGNCFRTTILKADRREVIADVIKRFPCDTESHINITLVQGILKGEKMDIIIQKTTELGVNEIIPVVTERSQLRETRKVTRWRKIAEEGSRQSGRSVVPVIREPVEFKKYFANQKYKFQGFIFFEEDGMKLFEALSSFVSRPSSVSVLIGPEGGFTKEEITLATEWGLHVISLGKRILRAETAAISAITLIQYLLGDLG